MGKLQYGGRNKLRPSRGMMGMDAIIASLPRGDFKRSKSFANAIKKYAIIFFEIFRQD